MDVLEYLVQIRGARAAAAEVKGVAGSFTDLAAAERRAGESGAAVATGAGRSGAALTALKRTAAGLGLALLGVGFEAVKASANFNHEMLRIRTDAGASTHELNNMKKGVLDLAASGQSMGQGPMSLAQGLYHLESLGIRGSKALQALKLASQETAISGANLEQTTSALGAAIYVGIKGTGDLNQTMGILNATVGAGNMRFQELVDALGTGVLASAKVAGLSIQDVGSALAVLSDGGQNAASGAAQLATALHFLYAPSSKASDALKSIGLNSTSLAVDMHKPQGLLVALRDLHDHLKGLTDVQKAQVLSDILPGGRGRVLLTLMEQLDRLQGKYQQINRTAGAFGGSVAMQRKDPQTQLKMQEAALQANLVRLGNVLQPILLPALNAIVSSASDVLKFMTQLPPKIAHAWEAFSKTSFGKSLISAITSIGHTAHQVFSGSFFKDLLTIGKAVGGFVLLVTKMALPSIASAFRGLVTVIGGFVKLISGILTLNFGKMWAGVKQIFSGAIRGIIGILGLITIPVRFVIGLVGKALVAAFNAFKDALVWMWNNVLKPVAEFVAGGFANAWNMAKAIFDAIAAPIKVAWQMLQQVFSALSSIANWVATAGQNVLNFFGSLTGNVGSLSPVISSIGSGATSPAVTAGPLSGSGATPRHSGRIAAHPAADVAAHATRDVVPHVTVNVGRHRLVHITRKQILDAMAQGA